MPRSEDDPYGNFNFVVEYGGDPVGEFTEISGLSIETEVIEYRAGNDKLGTVRKIPGLHKVSDITLKRGITKSTELWDWRKTVLKGDVQRRDVMIVLQDEEGRRVQRWKLANAWPVRYDAPLFNSTGNEIAIETLVITAESISLIP